MVYERAAAASVGLPAFCEAQHLQGSSNTFVVPLWDMPTKDDWLNEGLNLLQPTSIGAEAGDKPAEESDHARRRKWADEEGLVEKSMDAGGDAQRGDGEGLEKDSFESGTDSASQDCESSDDDESEPLDADEAPGSDVRAWSQTLVNGASMLVRSMPAVGASAGSGYSLAVPAVHFPRGALRGACDDTLDAILAETLATREPRWAILALQGGYFAGAIFRGPQIVTHKTFHRYACRAKQGGLQSAHDAKGKHAGSAGANMRRHGEQRLAEEIRDLLTKQWAEHLASCELLFVSAPKASRSLILGTGEQPYVRPEQVRILTSIAGRPTFEAMRSAHACLASVCFTRNDASPGRAPQAAEKASGRHAHASPLHAAAAHGDADSVLALLEAGADPTVPDAAGRTPFELAIRRARWAFAFWSDQNQNAWDWAAARVSDGAAEAEARLSGKRHGRRSKARGSAACGREQQPQREDRSGGSGARHRNGAKVCHRRSVPEAATTPQGQLPRQQQGRPGTKARQALGQTPQQRRLTR